MWYALLQDEQLGPMPATELAELFEQGVFTLETLVWREGMPEWVPLGRAPGFVVASEASPIGLGNFSADDDEDDENSTLMLGADALEGIEEHLSGPQPALGAAPAMQQPRPAPQQPALGAAPAMPQRPAPQQPAFGAAPQQPAFGAAPQQPAFGAAPQQPAFGAAPQQPAFGAAPQQPAFGAAPQQPAFGAAPQPPIAQPPAAIPSQPPVAAPSLAPQWDPTPVLEPTPAPLPDDFSPAAPVAPAAPSRKGAFIAVGAVLLLALGAAAFFLLRDPTPDTPTPPKPDPSALAGQKQPAEAPPSAPATQAPALAADAAVPDAAVAPEEPDAEVPDDQDAWVLDMIDIQDAGPPDAEPPPDAAPKAPAKPLTPEERQAAAARAEAQKRAREEAARKAKAAAAQRAAAKANAGKPVALDREEILSAIKANNAAIAACAQKDESARGPLAVAMVIKRDGQVASAKVVTARVRTSPAGRCLEDVLKKVRFKAFTGDPMRINLPLKL